MGLWGILVFLAPPVMMRISMKQYLDRTSRSVMELREAHDQVVATMDTLSRAYDGTLRALVAALDARDSETGGHSERVAELSIAMAEAMGVAPGGQEWLNIQRGALLHDVGKIAIPDEILRKPASLSEAEWAAMRTHPETGHQIIRTVEFLAPAAEIVRAHHERYDGSGYPRGLRGDEIPLGARIFAVADAFDAMTSDRPYRRALPREEALAEILRNSGSQFDPTAVRALLGVFEKRFLRDSPPHSPDGGISDSLKKAILEAAGLGGQP
jgi:putative nucleotidyltransferase with HDIG domain